MKTQSHVHRMRFCKTWHRTVIGYQTFYRVCGCCCSATKSCVTVCNPMDYSSQALLCSTVSQSLLKFISIESAMPSNHLILCCPFLICFQSFPASGSFPMSQLFDSSDQSIGTSVSTSILPNEYSGLISFRIDWYDLLTVQGTP